MGRKNEKTWKFGNFTVVNSWKPHCEKSEIYDFSASLKPFAAGYYRRGNRTWQRYDYERSLQEALWNLLDGISWKMYEEKLQDILEIRKALNDMKDYNWSNRN